MARSCVFLDTDTKDFDRGFAVGLIGPLIDDPGIQLVKAAYRRPFAADGKVVPDAGGRVNELVARPLINLLFPELAGIRTAAGGRGGRAARRCSSACRSRSATGSRSGC